MKALTRIPIFNYSTIATTLITDTKSLEIKLRQPYLSSETLFELESILAWCSAHPEVQSLSLTVYGDDFILGFNPEELKNMSEEKLQKLMFKTSTIIQSFFCLPQTVVMDLKKKAFGIGLEFALAADIRVCDPKANFKLDHLKLGLSPACGLFSFLKPFININALRSLLLSSKEFNVSELILLSGPVETDRSVTSIVKEIFTQAPVARMQTKRGLMNDVFNEDLNQKIEVERNLFNGSLATGDFRQEETFMSSTAFKEKLSAQSTDL
jgi:enoyl-CoA hydratase/carnithine racemase